MEPSPTSLVSTRQAILDLLTRIDDAELEQGLLRMLERLAYRHELPVVPLISRAPPSPKRIACGVATFSLLLPSLVWCVAW